MDRKRASIAALLMGLGVFAGLLLTLPVLAQGGPFSDVQGCTDYWDDTPDGYHDFQTEEFRQWGYFEDQEAECPDNMAQDSIWVQVCAAWLMEDSVDDLTIDATVEWSAEADWCDGEVNDFSWWSYDVGDSTPPGDLCTMGGSQHGQDSGTISTSGDGYYSGVYTRTYSKGAQNAGTGFKWCYEMRMPVNWVNYDIEITAFEINGSYLVTPTQPDCTELTNVYLFADQLTGTIGESLDFHAVAGPEDATQPITWTWAASDDGFVNRPTNSGTESWNDVTWWDSGTKTVTVTASNDCSMVTDTTTISITDLTYTPPFTIPDCDQPVYPPECGCPEPNWPIWQIGNWIDWLWCKLRCYLLFLADWLMYLWCLLKQLLLSIANTIIEWIWEGITWLRLTISEGFQKVIFWLRQLVAAMNQSSWSLGITDWLNCVSGNFAAWLNWQSVELFDWFMDTANNYGDFAQQTSDNLEIWLQNELNDGLVDWLNGSSTNMADWLQGTADNGVEWLNWQSVEIGDWWMDSANNYAAWSQGTSDFLDGWLQGSSDNLATSLQGTSDAITAWLNHWGSRIVNAMAPGYYWARGAIIGVQDLFQDIRDRIFTVIVGFATSIVEAMLSIFGLASFTADLSGELVSGFRDAVNADTEAELYESYGNLYYFFRGLQFFEQTAGDSPLAVLNLVSLGIIGVGLLYWTIGQAGDIFDDISRL